MEHKALCVGTHTHTQTHTHTIMYTHKVTHQKVFKLKADRPHPRDYLTHRHYSTHRQTPWTDNDSSLLFAALGKAEPLISIAARQKFEFDL